MAKEIKSVRMTKHMRIHLFVIFIFVALTSFSQGLLIKEFKQNFNDGSAFQAPLDANGHSCGLIKVRTDITGLKFRGDVVGETENKFNEYWVYMAQGSRQLKIVHPNYLPMLVTFSEYGNDEIDAKATYIMTLKEQKYNKEKNGLVATLKPETASFYVDNLLIENIIGDGYYQLYLPKGDHICRVEQKGYRSNVQVVTIGKDTRNIRIDLESVMAEMEVRCKMETSEIYIDGELKGNGAWKGEVFAGEHKIEVRQQNYKPYLQCIAIAEKESRTFVIPKLERATGWLRIESQPTRIPVRLDGKEIGMTPCSIELETGTHYIECNSFGLKPLRKEVEVNNDSLKTIEIRLDYKDGTWEKMVYPKAYDGDMDAIKNLLDQFFGEFRFFSKSRENAKEAAFWLERYYDPDKIIFDSFDPPCWIDIHCCAEKPERALEILQLLKSKSDLVFSVGYCFIKISEALFQKRDYDKAIMCYNKAIELNEDLIEYALEGLGDCYTAKGNKQLAATYYNKCLNLGKIEYKSRVEKKLREIGY